MQQRDKNSERWLKVLIKSKYLGSWEQREVRVSWKKCTLCIKSEQKQKQFPLEYITFSNKHHILHIQTQEERQYELKDINYLKNVRQLMKALNQYQLYKKVLRTKQNPVSQPVQINYFSPLYEHPKQQSKPNNAEEQMVQRKPMEQYKRFSSYIKEKDWRRDQKRGGIMFINEEKRSKHMEIISFVLKRVLKTGSFMGISFPVFAMKPESMLQTYCKAIAIAPLYLEKASDNPLSRMKAFNAIMIAFSFLFIDIDKPFNPTIGQTFQASIGGHSIMAQQISHHPPISAFILEGNNYKIHAILELDATIRINSALGIFYGEVWVEFADGAVVKGRMIPGIMSGLILGDNMFHPAYASYCYDPINHLVSSYEVMERDHIRGIIGELKAEEYSKFLSFIGESKNREKLFKPIPSARFDRILTHLDAIYSKQICYDGEVYVDYDDPKYLPFQLQAQQTKPILQSDSRNRTDIQLRGQQKIDQSQTAKQALEEEQRRLRKLRQAYKKRSSI